jgi:hypothetical protein
LVVFGRRFDIGMYNYEELLIDRSERNPAITVAQVGSGAKEGVWKTLSAFSNETRSFARLLRAFVGSQSKE